MPPHDEPYGFMERELAFRQLASRVITDNGFTEQLRLDPVSAAARLYIHLPDSEVESVRQGASQGTPESRARSLLLPADQSYQQLERELAFKLLAAHALVDPSFFALLKRDPASAAAELHIQLSDKDLRYLTNDVDWTVLEQRAPQIREALQFELVTNSW